MYAGLTDQSPVREDIIREYAIAKWRSELFYKMESSCLTSAVADERANPESAALIEQYGEDILLGHALRHDAAGPNVFSKLMRYGARVKKDLISARDAYIRLLDQIELERNNAKPISSPKAAAPPDQTPRNAFCPCGSGEKFKRCCGEGSPAVLHAA
jgi:SEC-C motif